MQRWQDLGRLVSSHMVIVVPAMLLCGIACPQALSWMRPAVPVMLAILTFQGSLNNTFSQLIDVFKKPLPLVLIMCATLVLMPSVAYLAARLLFSDNHNLVCGITLEYATPIAVSSFMWLSMYEGNIPLGLAVILLSTVLSPISIPMTLRVLMGTSIVVDVPVMMRDMTLEIALPALCGTLANDLSSGAISKRLYPILTPAARLIVPLIIGTNATQVSGVMRNLTPQYWGVICFMGLFALADYLWGIGLARLAHQPLPNFVTMCYTCGMRNISAGAVVALEFFPAEVLFPVMAGTLFQQVIAASFGSVLLSAIARERKRQAHTH